MQQRRELWSSGSSPCGKMQRELRVAVLTEAWLTWPGVRFSRSDNFRSGGDVCLFCPHGLGEVDPLAPKGSM